MGDVLYVTATATATNDIVAAVTGRKIKVLAMFASQASGTSFKFQSNATTELTNAITTTASDLNVVWPYNPSGWFQTASGEKLNFVPATSVATNINLVYILI